MKYIDFDLLEILGEEKLIERLKIIHGLKGGKNGIIQKE